jgi:hypothetical protein
LEKQTLRNVNATGLARLTTISPVDWRYAYAIDIWQLLAGWRNIFVITQAVVTTLKVFFPSMPDCARGCPSRDQIEPWAEPFIVLVCGAYEKTVAAFIRTALYRE